MTLNGGEKKADCLGMWDLRNSGEFPQTSFCLPYIADCVLEKLVPGKDQ